MGGVVETEQSAAPAPRNIVALATGFRHVIRGSKGMSTKWSAAELGSLATVVLDDAGVWRPDGLTAARIVLRNVVRAYADAEHDPRSRRDVTHTANVIARSWGVDTFPTDTVLGNPLLDRGDLTAQADEDAADDTDGEHAATGDADYARRSRWQKAVTRHPQALAAAASALALTWAQLDEEWAAKSTVSHPRWNTSARQVTRWPPDPMPGGEGGWLLARLGERLDDDPRLVAPGEDERARRAQLTQVLRRLAVNRHAAYLGTRLDTQSHYFHLRHAMARTWFINDLRDLGGADEFSGAADEGSVARETMLRSQASIARMEFYAVLHEWDAAAAAEVMSRRSSARRVFLGLENMPDALDQFQERLLKTPVHTPDKLDDQAVKDKADPSLPTFVNRAEPKAREIFSFALAVRTKPTRKIVAEYVTRRRDPEFAFAKLSKAGKRTVLLADQSVSLDCVNMRDLDLQKVVGTLLEESRAAGVEFGLFDRRDRAILGTKSGTREGLARAIDEGMRGIAGLYGIRAAAAHEYADVRVDERSALETEHQISLALAGAATRVLEDLMRADAAYQDRKSPGIVADEISGALHWSERTGKVLELLDDKGYLFSERYHDGYLASVGWRVPTRIIRHRALCAAYTVAKAYGIESSTLPTALDLDIAYDRMVSTIEIIDSQVPQVMQGVLLHSFLTAGRLPFPPRVSTALQTFDFITADVDPGRARAQSVHLDGANRILATLANFDRDWDFGAVGHVQVGTRIARALDDRSGGEFSHWRTYIDVLGFLRSGADDRGIACLDCRWVGPRATARGAHCPNCDSTRIRVLPTPP